MSWDSITSKLSQTCISAFSEDVEVHYLAPSGSEPEVDRIRGVYDSNYQQVDLQTGTIISSQAPMVEIHTSSLSKKLTTSAKIKVRGTIYRIKELQPDDSGAVKILLARS